MQERAVAADRGEPHRHGIELRELHLDAGEPVAIVMLLGMLGDVLLNAVGLTTGALAFLAGHVVAIILYRRNGGAPLTARSRLSIALSW